MATIRKVMNVEGRACASSNGWWTAIRHNDKNTRHLRHVRNRCGGAPQGSGWSKAWHTCCHRVAVGATPRSRWLGSRFTGAEVHGSGCRGEEPQFALGEPLGVAELVVSAGEGWADDLSVVLRLSRILAISLDIAASALRRPAALLVWTLSRHLSMTFFLSPRRHRRTART